MRHGCFRVSTSRPIFGGRNRPGGDESETTVTRCCMPVVPADRGQCWARSPYWPPMPGGFARPWNSATVAGRRWRSSMPWRELAQPVRMERIALLAPTEALRDGLAGVADTGLVELDKLSTVDAAATDAGRRLQRVAGGGRVAPVLAVHAPDLDALEKAGAA